MNWHETIKKIQADPAMEALVHDAYLTSALVTNCDRFMRSEEFQATLNVLEPHLHAGAKILDVGAGNGIAATAFARAGYAVTALEPDPSHMVGTLAIEHVAKELNLPKLEIVRSTTEEVDLPPSSFDAIYVRQALHHADDLERFVERLFALVKPDGVVLTVRDHEVDDEHQLRQFLDAHPLHKLYGGEHAYTRKQYETAFAKAGFEVGRRWTHFETPINFAPRPSEQILHGLPDGMIVKLRRLLGPLADLGALQRLIRRWYDARGVKLFDPSQVIGRSVAYLLKRPAA